MFQLMPELLTLQRFPKKILIKIIYYIWTLQQIIRKLIKVNKFNIKSKWINFKKMLNLAKIKKQDNLKKV